MLANSAPWLSPVNLVIATTELSTESLSFSSQRLCETGFSPVRREHAGQ